jgi:hypothetical protein
MKHWYAAANNFGINYAYDSKGWEVFVFESKADRDRWVDEDEYPNGNPTREAISRDTARKIVGERVRLVWNEKGDMGWFEDDNSYYNPHYWG